MQQLDACLPYLPPSPDITDVEILPLASFNPSTAVFSPIAFGDFKSVAVNLSSRDNSTLMYAFMAPVLSSVRGSDGSILTPLDCNIDDLVQVFPSSGILKKDLTFDVKVTVPMRKPPTRDIPPIIPVIIPAVPTSKGGRDKGKKVKPVSVAEGAVEIATVESKDTVVKSNLEILLDSLETCEITIIIPCIVKRIEDESARMAAYMKGVKKVGYSEEKSLISLQLVVPIIGYTFYTTSNCSFGQLATKTRTSQIILVTNVTDEPLNIRCANLPPLGPFYLSTATKTVEPNETIKVEITFWSESPVIAAETLEITDGKTTCRILVCGEAIKPQLDVIRDVTITDTCVGDTSTYSLILTNSCVLTLTCSVAFTDQNSPFLISESNVTIPPKSTTNAEIKFSPTLEFDNYSSKLSITFQGATPSIIVIVRSRSWGSSPVILGYSNHPESFKLLWMNRDKEFSGNHRPNRYCTIHLDWVNDDNRMNNIKLANLKCFVKMDFKKGGVDYEIFDYPGSFEYNEFLADYVLTPEYPNETGLVIDIGQRKGTIELDTEKLLTVKISDPTAKFLSKIEKDWNRIDNIEGKDGVDVTNLPIYFERTFKIIFSGGLRYSNPRGLLGEQTLFYLKFIVN